MPKLVSLLFFVLLTLGCTQPDSGPGGRPDNLVPEETMAKILTRVHLNEARVSKYALRSTDSAAVVFNRLQTQTLKQFGVDTTSYRKSYIYYSARPEILTRIYEQVVEQLKETQRATEKAAHQKPAS